jgi:hypothetical protein
MLRAQLTNSHLKDRRSMATTVALQDEIKVALPELKPLINNRWVPSVSGKPSQPSISPPAIPS